MNPRETAISDIIFGAQQIENGSYGDHKKPVSYFLFRASSISSITLSTLRALLLAIEKTFSILSYFVLYSLANIESIVSLDLSIIAIE